MTSSFLAEIPIPDFVDIILDGGERGDEAMYYLLHQRLERQLRVRFEGFRSQLRDDFEDVVEDFFLYLRDGGAGLSEKAYPSLRRIRDKGAFEAWMLNTFRNYVAMRADAEKRMVCDGLKDENIVDTEDTSSTLTDERKVDIASNVIAYAHQILPPRERFIFLRTMLTLLNKQQALPNDRVASVLDMSEISYRVTVHRLKRNLAGMRAHLLGGGDITLDDPHRQMAQQINEDFSRLYQTLMMYYGQSIDNLSNAAAVRQLRQEYCNITGLMLHEQKSPYHIATNITTFWLRLTEFLTDEDIEKVSV